jgi:uncharacterized protein (TIGR00255 family)
MLQSMTAIAVAETIEENNLSVRTEIRSYNSKNLDISLRMTAAWLALEERVKRAIAERISRGRVEINLRMEDRSEAAMAFDIDEAKAQAYHSALLRLKESLGLSGDIALEQLASVHGIIKPAETVRDPETDWPVVSACLEKALDELTAMRQKEGAFMADDLAGRLGLIEAALTEIEVAAADITSQYRGRLLERITRLTDGQVALDEARIAQEAAILADRSDISEEIVRAASHIAQFRDIMGGSDPAGRKLNFLLQEFNREFNTMGSKAGSATISHKIVEVKSELEKMREQVQNIE